jgi:hypothetical protein
MVTVSPSLKRMSGPGTPPFSVIAIPCRPSMVIGVSAMVSSNSWGPMRGSPATRDPVMVRAHAGSHG